jgi:DNA-binding CsgD family transcriptional regulator/pimeloyl-ACP methyl ester carboxylesterase
MLFPHHVSHVRLNWHVGLHRHAFEFFARRFTVVNLDLRGAGESGRQVADVSLDGFVRDIDAVMSCQGLERACLCAMGPASLVACHYARRAPRRVAGLAFVQPGDSEANRQLLQVRRANAHLEARLRGGALGGPHDEQNAMALAAVAREALDSESLAGWLRVLGSVRVEALTDHVDTPAICVHATEDDLVSADATRRFARLLPNATVFPVHAATGMQIWREDTALDALDAFFSTRLGLRRAVAVPSRQRRSMAGGFTAREVTVLRLVAAGRTNEQIGADLCISAHTVSHHLRSIFAKTRAANRTQAAAFARQRGLT